YVYGSVFPLDAVTSRSLWADYLLQKSDDPKQQAEYDRRKPIRDIVYNPDDADVIIVEFIRNGFVDWSSRQKLLVEENHAHESNSARTELMAVWGLYHGNFRASQEQFVTAQEVCVEKHLDRLALSDIDGVVQFVRQLGMVSPKLESALSRKIQQVAHRITDETALDHGYIQISAETANQLRLLIRSQLERKSIGEALAMMTSRDGWNPRDIRHLDGVSSSEFYDFLTNNATES